MSIAIGIDLGTTNSCVAFYRNDRAEVIENDEGDRTTPSFVFFSKEGPLVGKLARDNTQPTNGIFGAKRFIGKRFSDNPIQNEISNYAFKVIPGPNDEPLFVYTTDSGEKHHTPEQISTLVLLKLVKAAQDKLGDAFNNNVVITVPAHFNNEQRKATKRVGEAANLNVIRLLNEPTAAALAYAVNELNNNQQKQHRTIAVYDFGGGTFDISIIEVEGRKVTTKAIDGDSHLGGDDIDNRLFQKIIQQMSTTYHVDIAQILENRRTVRRIRTRCEEAKVDLSTKKTTDLNFDYLLPGIELISITLTRQELEDVNMDLFVKTINIVEKCLTQAKLKCDDIDEVVLVGGSSRIPKIQELLGNVFGKDKILKRINMHEAVAMGAAIQAALLNNTPDQAIEDVVLTDVLSESLGTDIEGNKMSIILHKNAPLPTADSRRYKTVYDNQDFMRVRVLEGGHDTVEKNLCLGEMRIDGLTKAPAGAVKTTVSFKVDLDGILHVTATEDLSGAMRNLQISLNK